MSIPLSIVNNALCFVSVGIAFDCMLQNPDNSGLTEFMILTKRKCQVSHGKSKMASVTQNHSCCQCCHWSPEVFPSWPPDDWGTSYQTQNKGGGDRQREKLRQRLIEMCPSLSGKLYFSPMSHVANFTYIRLTKTMSRGRFKSKGDWEVENVTTPNKFRTVLINKKRERVSDRPPTVSGTANL